MTPVQKAIYVLDKCYQHIQQHAYDLEKEGVFRIAGQRQEVLSLLDSILNAKGEIPDDASIYNVLDVIKSVTVSSKEPLVENKCIESNILSILENEDRQESTQAFKQFLQDLADSDLIEEKQLASVIFMLVHLCHQTQLHADKNKMASENLAITPLTPFMLQLANPDPIKLVSLSTGQGKDNMAECISDPFFSQELQSALGLEMRAMLDFEIEPEKQTSKKENTRPSLFRTLSQRFFPHHKSTRKQDDEPEKPVLLHRKSSINFFARGKEEIDKNTILKDKNKSDKPKKKH